MFLCKNSPKVMWTSCMRIRHEGREPLLIMLRCYLCWSSVLRVPKWPLVSQGRISGSNLCVWIRQGGVRGKKIPDTICKKRNSEHNCMTIQQRQQATEEKKFTDTIHFSLFIFHFQYWYTRSLRNWRKSQQYCLIFY